MRRLGNIYIAVASFAFLIWGVPWLCRLIQLESYSSPFTLYSPIINDFAWIDKDSGKDLRFIDRAGNSYGEEIQPLFYHSVLSSRGSLPDSIGGVAVTDELIRRNRQFITLDPKSVNRVAPKAYPLMESIPLRLELQDPEYAFVCKGDGLRIYKMETNSYEADLSAAFNEALKREGFSFPAGLVSGNPSHKKDHDEGWLLTDSRSCLFQMQLTDSKPVVRILNNGQPLSLKDLLVTEPANHSTLAYLFGQDGRLSMLTPDGKVHPTEVVFNPSKEALMVVGDLLYYTIKVSDLEGERFYALRSDDFSLLDTMDRIYPDVIKPQIWDWILPCRLHFLSSRDGYVLPRFEDFSLKGLIVDLFAAVVILLFCFKRKGGRKAESC